MLFVFLTTLALQVGACFALRLNLIHPAVVWSSIWLSQVVGLVAFGDHFTAPSNSSLALVLLANCAFFCACILTSGALAKVTANRQTRRRGLPRVPRYMLARFIAAFIIAVWLLSIAVAAFRERWSEGLGSAMIIIRTSIGDGERPLGLGEYGYTVSLAALVAYLCVSQTYRLRLPDKVLLTAFLLTSSAIGFLSTGRGAIVKPIVITAVWSLLAGGLSLQRKFALALAAVASTLLAFILGGQLLGKVSTEATSWTSSLIAYQWSPIPAFSVWLDSTEISLVSSSSHQGSITRFPQAVAFRFGLSESPPAALPLEFVDVPNSTNTFTVFRFWIQEFGFLGLLLGSISVGAFHGWLYRVGSPMGAPLPARYCLIVSYLPLLTVAGGEVYIQQLSTWIQLTILGVSLVGERRRSRTYRPYV
jgi:oligosaccharide repeat unit polymerase